MPRPSHIHLAPSACPRHRRAAGRALLRRVLLVVSSFVFCSVSSFLAAPVQSAAAQRGQHGVSVQWHAPPECPDKGALLRALRLPSDGASEDLVARATVVAVGTQYRLDLELRTPRSRARRSLVHPRCDALMEAAAVLIALAVDPEASELETGSDDALDATQPPERPAAAVGDEGTQRGRSRSGDAGQQTQPGTTRRPDQTDADAQDATAEARSDSATVDPPTSSEPILLSTAPPSIDSTPFDAGLDVDDPHDSTGDGVHIGLGAGLRVGTGMLPHVPALGVQGQLSLSFARLHLGLGFTYWPAREQRSQDYPDALLRGTAALGDVSLGFRVLAAPLLLVPAVHFELGQVRAVAVGIDGPEASEALWTAAGAGVLGRVLRLQNWSLSLEIAGLVPILRTRWLVRTPQGDMGAFLSEPLVLRAGLHVSYAIW